MDNNYKHSVENLEKMAKTFEPYMDESARAVIAWNLFYLKLQPQYDLRPTVQ